MVDFSSMKNSDDLLKRLSEEATKLTQPVKTFKADVDERFWKPTLDKAGNGSAVIRFLPPPAVDGADAKAWIRIFSHGFQGPTGKWYIEKSLTTLGQKDPVGEFNSALWNETQDENSPQRKQARDQKRKLRYTSNIYVVSDPKNPEAEGKVFLFSYGKKIFDKIMLLFKPEFEGDTPVNVFDFYKGANFKLRTRKIGGYPNYDESSFESPSPLLNGDDVKLKEIWASQYSLNEFLNPKEFKSYDELKARFNEVMSGSSVSARGSVYVTSPKTVSAPTATSSVDVDDDDDEDLRAFKALAE